MLEQNEGGGGRGGAGLRRGRGGPMSRVQPYGRRNHPARPPARPPPSPQQAAAAVLRGGGSGEAATAARPLLVGPSLDSGEGKETRQGEVRSNTNQQPCLCLRLILKRRMLNLKRANSMCVRGCVCGGGGVSGIRGRSREEAAYGTSCTSLKMSWLPPGHERTPRRPTALLPFHVLTSCSV